MVDSNETVMYENGRDAGYAEGFEYGLLSNVKKLNPYSTEAITLFYDREDMDELDVSDTVYLLQREFPNNKVIALPNKESLESCSKDVLENIISMISEIIEEL